MKVSERKEIERIIRKLWVRIPAEELEDRFGIKDDEILTVLAVLNRGKK
jgi:hypothetical protein